MEEETLLLIHVILRAENIALSVDLYPSPRYEQMRLSAQLD